MPLPAGSKTIRTRRAHLLTKRSTGERDPETGSQISKNRNGVRYNERRFCLTKRTRRKTTSGGWQLRERAQPAPDANSTPQPNQGNQKLRNSASLPERG